MERFTKKDSRGDMAVSAYVAYWVRGDKYDTARVVGYAVDKLAAYEDTGLTPEDIVKLKTAYNCAVKLALGFDDDLAAMEKERDAAVEDMENLGDGRCDTDFCKYCKHDKDRRNCMKNGFTWRGVLGKEDEV